LSLLALGVADGDATGFALPLAPGDADELGRGVQPAGRAVQPTIRRTTRKEPTTRTAAFIERVLQVRS
jgi:hypothetical protein